MILVRKQLEYDMKIVECTIRPTPGIKYLLKIAAVYEISNIIIIVNCHVK
jgi:hypothetical protein